MTAALLASAAVLASCDSHGASEAPLPDLAPPPIPVDHRLPCGLSAGSRANLDGVTVELLQVECGEGFDHGQGGLATISDPLGGSVAAITIRATGSGLTPTVDIYCGDGSTVAPVPFRSSRTYQVGARIQHGSREGILTFLVGRSTCQRPELEVVGGSAARETLGPLFVGWD